MKRMISLQSEDEALQRTLMSSYYPIPIKQARERQDEMLLQRLRHNAYTIADIGCGNGYHAVLLATSTRVYHGFEVSPALAQAAHALWRKEHIDNARVFVGDAALAILEDALTTSFSVCISPRATSATDPKTSGYIATPISTANPRFIQVISRFHRAMKAGGRMFLTLYKDVPEAEAAQVDYYVHTGQHVVTPSGSRFVATAEGFWSARWTRDSLLSNLDACGIRPDAVAWNDLNDIAWLVEVVK